MANKKIVIIGSGLAGYMVAKEFRKLDMQSDLTIITQDSGSFYSKPQLSISLTQKKTIENLVTFSADQMSDSLPANIINHATVTHIDLKEKRITYNQKFLDYDYLVLAVGAKKITPSLEGDAVSSVCSVNNLDEYALFREWLIGKKNICVLGSGLVGCEFSNDLRNSGFDVNVISPDSYPLMRFLPEKIGKIFQKKFEEHGVSWHFNKFIKEISKNGDKFSAMLNDGSVLETDGVFSAIGVLPNIVLAQEAGLVVNRGIVTNDRLQTSDPFVFSIGDCAETTGQIRQYIAPILHSARILARNLVGDLAEVVYPIMPVVVKTPFFPIVMHLPVSAGDISWEIEGGGIDWRALAFHQEKLMGFVLSGECTRQKNIYMQKIST